MTKMKLNNDIGDLVNPYLPVNARILDIIDEAPDIKTFRIKLLNGHETFAFKPGQFAIWSLPGVGEAPFSFSSAPHIKHYLDFTIHKIGTLTSTIFGLKVGDVVGIRGPYGNGFPIEKFVGKNLVLVMGGIGAAPLKGVLDNVLYYRTEFENIKILHGAREPELLLFKDYFFKLVSDETVDCRLTVDTVGDNYLWKHNVGVVTTLLDNITEDEINSTETIVMICGPPIMYKFVIAALEKYKIPQNQIYMTLERRMKCGLGLCGHCAIDYVYTCVEGPVFTLWDARYLKEMI